VRSVLPLINNDQQATLRDGISRVHEQTSAPTEEIVRVDLDAQKLQIDDD
jgi:hypothetical protein